MLGVPVSKASVIISKEWKKVKASRNKLKKYKDLYEEEKKKRHEVALQRYEEDYVDEMEIINLYKKCSKKEPKKGSDDPSKEEQKSKKSDGKNDYYKTSSKSTKKPLSLLIRTQTMNKNLS